jgi:cell division protein FtsZ
MSELPTWPPEVTTLVVKNECLIPLYEDASGIMQQKGMRNILFRLAVQSITDIITQHTIICADFSDIGEIIGRGGNVLLGIGYGSGSECGAADAVQNALQAIDIDENRSRIKGVVVTIYASASITLDDYDDVNRSIRDKIPADSEAIISIVIIEELGQNYRIYVVAATNASIFYSNSGTQDNAALDLPAFNRQSGRILRISRAEEARRTPA